MYSLFPAVGNLTAAMIVLAHQGGWDEILMVAVPVAVFAGLLYVANNRASKLGEESSADPTGDVATDPSSDPSKAAGRQNADGTGGDDDGDKQVKYRQPSPPPQNPHRGPI